MLFEFVVVCPDNFPIVTGLSGQVYYTPKIMFASMPSLLLIIRPTFKVGSLFPERYSLTLDGLTPNIFDNLSCVSPISCIRSFRTSASEGDPIAKCSSE